MQSLASRSVVVGILALIGCRADGVTSIPEAASDEQTPQFSSSAPGCTLAGLPEFCVYWEPGAVITFYKGSDATDAMMTAVRDAASRWNAVGILQFAVTTEDTGDIRVGRFADQPGTGWCGQTQQGSDGIPPTFLNFRRGTCGTLANVALHELAHVAGFNGNWHKAGNNGYTSLAHAGHCAFELRDSLGVEVARAAALCQHEIEAVKYIYDERPAPNFFAHIVTGIRPPAMPATVDLQTSIAVGPARLLYRLSNGSRCGLQDWQNCLEDEVGETSPSPLLDLWSSTSSQIATVARTSSGATITTGSTPGSTQIQITRNLSSTRSADFSPGNRSLSVENLPSPPAAPPTALSTSGITSSSAVISWTAGDSLASTAVQYQPVGSATWLTASAGVGSSSVTLSGLLADTPYSVRAYHQREGFNSTVVTMADPFRTLPSSGGGSLVVNGYWTSACSRTTSGGKLYNRWTHRWTSQASGMTFFAIRESGIDDSTTGSIVKTGKFFLSEYSTVVGSYLVSSVPRNRYFWIQLSNDTHTTSWFPLADNPLNVAGPCAV